MPSKSGQDAPTRRDGVPHGSDLTALMVVTPNFVSYVVLALANPCCDKAKFARYFMLLRYCWALC